MKHFSTLLLLLFFVNIAFSQLAPEIEWQKIIGGDDDDGLSNSFQTLDGGYILAGTSASGISGDKTEEGLPEDYWIVKLDGMGNIEWQNSIGGAFAEGCFSIKQTIDGGYITAGSSSSGISGDKTEESKGENDYWLVKLDHLGNIEWDKTIGGSSGDELRCLSLTFDGGYILGGYSVSNASGDKTEDNISSDIYPTPDYWVIKVDVTGNVEWNNTIGGADYDYLSSIHQTSDGGYIIGGWSQSGVSGDKTEERLGIVGPDYWIVKLDAEGDVQWDNTIGGTDHDYLSSIHQTSDGGYILGGSSASGISIDKTENSWGDSDYWIVKLNASGDIEWDNTIGGDLQDEAASVHQTNDGGYIVSGSSNSNVSGDKIENSVGDYPADDFWMLKLNDDGTIEWQKTIGFSGRDINQTVQETSDGGYLLAGSYSQYVDGTESDYWVVKLEGSVDVATELENGVSLNIFPNPAKECFTIEINAQQINNAEIKFFITNILGEEIFIKSFQLVGGKLSETIQMNENIPSGMYTLILAGKQIISSSKIFIE